MAHIHSIYDTDKHFTIDPVTRAITAESEKLTLTQYDHNSERYTFELPRMIEGHDMSQCDYVQIHFENVSKNKKLSNNDLYTVTDLQVSPDSDDVVILSWLISDSATQLVGKLRFSIRFECVSETGSLEYSWGTTDFDDIKIVTGVNNTDSVVVEHSDFVARVEALLGEYENGVKSVNGEFPDENGNVKLSGLPEVTAADEGAILRVVDGAWSIVQLSNAEEVAF